MKIFFILFKNRLSAGIGLYPNMAALEKTSQGDNPFGGQFMKVLGVTGVLSEGSKLSTKVREKLL